jgi:serine/threonine protein kinase
LLAVLRFNSIHSPECSQHLRGALFGFASGPQGGTLVGTRGVGVPLSPATRLGPYEILSAIGAGGMGEVYRAKDTRLDRIVAIKILPEHRHTSPQARERLRRSMVDLVPFLVVLLAVLFLVWIWRKLRDR